MPRHFCQLVQRELVGQARGGLVPQVVKIPTAGQNAQDSATMLRSFTTNIDVVRQLTRFYGYGPL